MPLFPMWTKFPTPCEDALEIMDDFLQWLIWGHIDQDGTLAIYKELIAET